jgi:hypothetical protein
VYNFSELLTKCMIVLWHPVVSPKSPHIALSEKKLLCGVQVGGYGPSSLCCGASFVR